MKGHQLSACIAILASAWTTHANSHESLYNTAEIHLTAPGTISIHFSVHAPELILAPETDFGAIGDDWLAAKQDGEIEELVTLAREFVSERYGIYSKDRDLVSKLELQFEHPSLIRVPDREGGPRPGCILASLLLENPGGELTFSYKEEGEKRLLLATIRPASFPKTHDLEAGTAVVIPLPEPPEKPFNQAWYLVPLALAFAVVNWMVIRRKTSKLSVNS